MIYQKIWSLKKKDGKIHFKFHNIPDTSILDELIQSVSEERLREIDENLLIDNNIENLRDTLAEYCSIVEFASYFSDRQNSVKSFLLSENKTLMEEGVVYVYKDSLNVLIKDRLDYCDRQEMLSLKEDERVMNDPNIGHRTKEEKKYSSLSEKEYNDLLFKMENIKYTNCDAKLLEMNVDFENISEIKKFCQKDYNDCISKFFKFEILLLYELSDLYRQISIILKKKEKNQW